MVPWLTVVPAIFVAGLAFFIHNFADQIDQQLNACGTGIYVDGGCKCVHPYVGTHCEVIDCGYGELIDSVWDVDSITTPLGDIPSGCKCASQYWGYNCANCTSMFDTDCTGACRRDYYGARCEVLCKEGTADNAQGVLHEESGGTYNFFVSGRGMCLRDGTVQCKKGTAGPDCGIDCKACKYGNCDAMTGECNCFAGFAGELCDQECPGRCSGNNGVCRWDGEFAYCECAIKHTGADCSLDCCARGNRTTLGVTNGECAVGVGGCICDNGWAGDECDCHPDKTCGSRGTCLASGGCDCSRNFVGRNCEQCADDRIGPFCQYDKYTCPDNPGHGELVALNSHGDYGCKCDAGFTGELCDECTASAYPKNGSRMCEFVVPGSMCHFGRVKDDYSGSGTMCVCDGHYSAASDCAGCKPNYFGPACDILCTTACTESGGKCAHTPTPGCLCPRGMREVNGRCQICGGDGGCIHGDCYGGRCECDAGWYGDNCGVSAPQFKGKTCNGDNGVPLVHKETASCTTAADCTDTSHPTMANAQVALRAQKYARTMFCYRSDVPATMRTVSGCCVDSNADGKCDAEHLLKNEPACEDLVGEMAQDICNSRVLEGEVNVFEWCLSQTLGCTKNGACADPEFCADRCDAGLTPAQWKTRWEMDHVKDMATLMSEPWRFPIDFDTQFDDPYPHRAKYVNASLSDVCPLRDQYDVCVDYLIPTDASVYNLQEKFVSGKWTQMPSYDRCKFTKHIKEVNVDGNKTVVFEKLFVHNMKMISDTDQTIAYGRLGDSDEAYYGEVNAEIDRVTLYGRGTVELVMYEFTDETCEDFLLRSAADFIECKTLKFHELDYRWGKFCKWAFTELTGVPGFVEKCYDQSRVCAGCEDYEEGCEGLPLGSSPMPPPCASNWGGFCDVYMDTERNVQGTCAYADCECTGYGIGGEACGYNCPVPQYTGNDQPCGEGEDVPWGKCVKGSGAVAFGYEQGTCECFNGGNPSEGCAMMCTEEQSCSPDIDTLVTVHALECDYANIESLSGNGWAYSNGSLTYFSDVVTYNKSTCGIGDEEAVGVCLKGPYCDVEISFEQTAEVCEEDILVHIYGDRPNASTVVSPDEHCETGVVKEDTSCADACVGHDFYSTGVNESVACICFNASCETVSGGTLYRYYSTPSNPGTTPSQRVDACFHACRDKNDMGNPLTWSTVNDITGFAVDTTTGHCGCTGRETNCAGSGYLGHALQGPKCMPRPTHLELSETPENGHDRLFWGVPRDPIVCNILLPDSMCNFWRGKCECAQPFTTFRKNNVPVHLNPDQSYRIALMQGYGIDEYAPFMKYQEPLPSIVTQVSQDRFCGNELDGLDIDEYTCTSCLGETINKNIDTFKDANGQSCFEYDVDMCGTADLNLNFFALSTGTCATSSIFGVNLQSIEGSWSTYDCEAAGNELGLSGTTDVEASALYSGCSYNGVDTKVYDFMPNEYTYASGTTCDYDTEVTDAHLGSVISLARVGSSTCMGEGHYKINTPAECDLSLTSLGLPGLVQRCREFAGSMGFSFGSGNNPDRPNGCVYNEAHGTVYHNRHVGTPCGTGAWECADKEPRYMTFMSGTCESNGYMNVPTPQDCDAAAQVLNKISPDPSAGYTALHNNLHSSTFPSNCWVNSNYLIWNTHEGVDCTASSPCVCKSRERPLPSGCSVGGFRVDSRAGCTDCVCKVSDTPNMNADMCKKLAQDTGWAYADINLEFMASGCIYNTAQERMRFNAYEGRPCGHGGWNCALHKGIVPILSGTCSGAGLFPVLNYKDCVDATGFAALPKSVLWLVSNPNMIAAGFTGCSMVTGSAINFNRINTNTACSSGSVCFCSIYDSSDSYAEITSGTCEDAGFYPILDEDVCTDALRITPTNTYISTHGFGGPASGCTRVLNSNVIFNYQYNPDDRSNCIGYRCICQKTPPVKDYVKIPTGTCESNGFTPIKSIEECKVAIQQFEHKVPTYFSGGVRGCSLAYNGFRFGTGTGDCSYDNTCICKRLDDHTGICDMPMPSMQGGAYMGCDGARTYNDYTLAQSFCDGSDPTPYIDDHRVFFKTCCEWTGSACVERGLGGSHVYTEEDGPCTLGNQVATKEDLALAVKYMYGISATFAGTGGGYRVVGSMAWEMGSETCSASHPCVCKIKKFVTRVDKCPHGYSLSVVSDVCELNPTEIKLSVTTSNLGVSVITFNTYPPDCPEQTFTHHSENVWMGDHANAIDKRKVIVDGEIITCANL